MYIIILWVLTVAQLVCVARLVFVAYSFATDVHQDRAALKYLFNQRSTTIEESAAMTYILGSVNASRLKLAIAAMYSVLGALLLLAVHMHTPVLWSTGAIMVRLTVLVLTMLQLSITSTERATRREVLRIVGVLPEGE